MRILLVLTLLFAGTACRKKAEPEAPRPVAAAATPVAEKPKTVEQAVQQVAQNFRRVNFAFDSTQMVGESNAALSENARILQAFTEVRVEIQGHADERGTTEYNLALGQRRADAVHRYLVGQTVPVGRLRTVSFGKERPADPASNERAWARNRRVELIVED